MILWITGQPGSGKSTLAKALEAALLAQGRQVIRLDGDELRKQTGNVDFTAAGRIANVKAGQRLALEHVAQGNLVVAAFVSPYRWQREELKRQHEVLEIYTHTDKPTLKEGFRAPDYEPPLVQFVDIDTGRLSLESAVEQILVVLSERRKLADPSDSLIK